MKILSGVDIVLIDRLGKINPAIRKRFFARVFNEDEQGYIQDVNERAAGIFAAKEAVSKALGTGIGRVSWQDIHIHHEPSGKPAVILHGTAKEVAKYMDITSWSVSISHSRDSAVALAVALSNQE